MDAICMNELWEARESLLGQGPGTVACPAIKTPWCFSKCLLSKYQRKYQRKKVGRPSVTKQV